MSMRECPFCGSTADGKIFITESVIHCLNSECGAKIVGDHLIDLIEKWNRRNPIKIYVKPNGLILSRNRQPPQEDGSTMVYIEQENGDFLGVYKGSPFKMEIPKYANYGNSEDGE